MFRRRERFGFTLNETSELLGLIERNLASCDNVAQRAEEKVKLIDQKIRELTDLKEVLLANVGSCGTCCEPASSENCELLIVK